MQSKKRKSTLDESSLPSNKWLTTFNDLATLLMVFFVLLFSMSVIDVKKIKQFQSSLQSGLGVLHAGQKASVAVVDARGPQDSEADMDGRDRLNTEQKRSNVRKIEQSVEKMNRLDGVSATYEMRGITITMDENLLFRPGSARIRPASHQQLDRVAGLIRQTESPVRIEGHTDNIPIKTRRYPSNWELSVARAVQVLRFLIDNGSIEPRRLSAVGYGAARPIANNDTPDNRARNRRVEIVLVTEG